jgi:hypothetical protein
VGYRGQWPIRDLIQQFAASRAGLGLRAVLVECRICLEAEANAELALTPA